MGHNIQHRKNRQDAKRGSLWTKIIREVTVGARRRTDPSMNARLRLALDKARPGNVPKDKLQNAIVRAAPASSRAPATRKSATRATASAARRS